MPVASASFTNCITIPIGNNPWGADFDAAGDPDGAFANCPIPLLSGLGARSDNLFWDQPGVSIPASSRLTQLQVQIYRFCDNGFFADDALQFQLSGVPLGPDLSIFANWSTVNGSFDTATLDVTPYNLTDADAPNIQLVSRGVNQAWDSSGDIGHVDSAVLFVTFDRLKLRRLLGVGL